jgi:hypothetical protein
MKIRSTVLLATLVIGAAAQAQTAAPAAPKAPGTHTQSWWLSAPSTMVVVSKGHDNEMVAVQLWQVAYGHTSDSHGGRISSAAANVKLRTRRRNRAH